MMSFFLLYTRMETVVVATLLRLQSLYNGYNVGLHVHDCVSSVVFSSAFNPESLCAFHPPMILLFKTTLSTFPAPVFPAVVCRLAPPSASRSLSSPQFHSTPFHSRYQSISAGFLSGVFVTCLQASVKHLLVSWSARIFPLKSLWV